MPGVIDWRGFEPSEEQLQILRLSYANFDKTAEWPFVQFLRIQAIRQGLQDFDESLRGFPIDYFYPRVVPYRNGDEVWLTVPALTKVEVAQDDLLLFIRVLQMLVPEIQSFEPTPREIRLIELSAAKLLANSPDISDLQLRKLFSLLRAEPIGSTGHGPDGPTSWYVRMDLEEAQRLSQATSTEEYLRLRHRFPDENTSSVSATNETELPPVARTQWAKGVSRRPNARLDLGVVAALVAVAIGAAVLDRGGALRAILLLAVFFCSWAGFRMRHVKWRLTAFATIGAAFGIWFIALLPTSSLPEQPPASSQVPSSTAPNGGSPEPSASPASTTSTPSPEPETRIEEVTLERGQSTYVLNRAVRVSVIGIDFSGSPLRYRVDAVVTELETGASLTMASADVGFDESFGDRQTYRVILLAADTFEAQFEIRRIVEGQDDLADS